MSLTPEQLELRRKGVGGSEVAAVLGVATRKTDRGDIRTGFDVWLSKRSPVEREDSEDALRGIHLERGVIDWYCQRTGSARAGSVSTVVHATRPVALCTPDALVFPTASATQRIVSVKCPRHAHDWGEEGTDDIPIDYAMQLQWEHAVLSSHGYPLDPLMHLACFVSGELRIYHVLADAEMQGWMLDDVEAWWQRHMVEGVPPPLDASGGCREYLARRWIPRADVREASPGEVMDMMVLRETRRELEAAEERYEVARRKVEAAIADAGGLSSKLGTVTWKQRKDGKRVFRQEWERE